MNFTLEEAIEILERTPKSLEAFLSGLSDEWLTYRENEDTWNVTEVIEHLIECEKNNWIPRLEVILSSKEDKTFPEFNRFRHLEERISGTITEKLAQFNDLRKQNIASLKERLNSEHDLERTGIHPVFGEVKLRELISTWVTHDLTHIVQIMRVMASRYREDVGPWVEYLSILKQKGN